MTKIVQLKFWLILSLIVSAICGFLGILPAFSSEYVVQDDARSHVVWMLRFLDSDLFSNDIIADYFQSLAPSGYVALYYLMAKFGIDPIIFNKLLPTILGLITTGYCFGVCFQIFPIPSAGFLATLLLNQNLWLKDDLVSATPRAFFYPLFLGFLYYLLRSNLFGVGVTIAFLGLFYPQGVLICAAILILHFIRFPVNKINYQFLLTALGIAVLVLLPYALNSSKFGSVIALADANKLPEFWPGGRASFFTDNSWDFWITGDRSGFFPREWLTKLLIPPQVLAGLLLPIMLRYSGAFPLIKQINNRIVILPELALASTGIFFVAHAFAFKFHHPSRYTQHSLRILMAIAGGIAIAIVIDAILPRIKMRFISLGILTLFLIYPSLINSFPVTNYIVGKVPILYEFLSQQPKDTLIASLAIEANNLPAFAQRSILVGSEYALPYHKLYYNEMNQRSNDLIKAQYSNNLKEVQNFIQKYGIDFWLLDSPALTLEYVNKNHRIGQLNPVAAAEVKASLEKGSIPALSKVTNRCTVLKAKDLILLNAKCIEKFSN
ncbi:hypothetical protein BCD67_23780 [Oscillatoriales cyanobacterium USR001]|nr:hypothetical protein BCD67_23780 [Oscillatoriales cyanobacterium USR001]